MKIDRRRPDLLVADGVVSEELASLVTEAVAAASFEEQQLGSRLYRYRERAVIESPAIAAGLWEALAAYVGDLGNWLARSAATWERPAAGWKAVSCNPRSRVYRYHRVLTSLSTGTSRGLQIQTPGRS